MALPLNYGPRLHEFAFRPLEEDKRINILVGAVRSGKTYSMIPKVLRGCRFNVGGWRLLTGVSKQTIFNNVLNDLFNLIGQRHWQWLNRQAGILNIMGATWLVMGAKDEGSEKYLRGLTAGLVIADEITLMPEEFYNMLISRMSPEGSRFYATTNCDSPRHWLKEKVLDNERLKREGKLFEMTCTLEDNPNLPEDYKETLKASFKGLFYRRYVLGQWVMAEGSIWGDCWDDSLIFDEPPMGMLGPGGYQDRWIAVDYGTNHPQVYGEFYDDGTTVWMTREYFWSSTKEMQQKTDAQYADDLMAFMGPEACQIIVPPEAASFRAELVMRGLWNSDANNEVLEGIQTVAGLMATKKLRIQRKCVNTLKGIELYCWDPKAALRGEEKPIMVDDDAAAMLRYACHGKIPLWRYGG